MNAVYHPVSRFVAFKWLLKREYWEHRGGFLWAPLIAGAASLVIACVAIIIGLFALTRASRSGSVHINGTAFNINGLDLNLLTQQITAERAQNLAGPLDAALWLGSSWPFLVMAFVVFFYCLGALYDDRRDRSILFWKSLPISDTATVLSKAASALVIAPALAVIASTLTMFVFALILSALILFHGGNPITLLWGPASPLNITLGHLAWIPVYALWALPTVGWLLMCSAWARSKAFLWAVLLPVLTGVVVTSTNLMAVFDLNSNWFWKHIVARLLLSAAPGSEMVYRYGFNGQVASDSAAQEFSAMTQLQLLQLPSVWIGAAFGVAFLLVAIFLRRRSGEI